MTSNVLPVLWKIDPTTLAVSVHRVELDADTDKDVGFSGLVYSERNGAYFAVSELHGSLWRIDPLLRRAQKVSIEGMRAGRAPYRSSANNARASSAGFACTAGRLLDRPPGRGPALCVPAGGRLLCQSVHLDRRYAMKYRIKQIHCRPWTLNGLSLKLIESHYENNYGGAMRRLNAITEQLASLDQASTPGHVLNGLKREELVALNSTLLHELYFASLGGDGQPTKGASQWLAEQFGSLERWRAEFRAMGALGGGSGWVVLTYVRATAA